MVIFALHRFLCGSQLTPDTPRRCIGINCSRGSNHAKHRVFLLIVSQCPIVQPSFALYRFRRASARIRMTRKLIACDNEFFSTIALAKVVNIISSFAISPTARILFLHGNHSRLVGLKVHVHRFTDPEKNKSLRDFLSRKRGPIISMVPSAGLEPVRDYQWILSPSRLPIPPTRLVSTTSSQLSSFEPDFTRLSALRLSAPFCVAWSGPH